MHVKKAQAKRILTFRGKSACICFAKQKRKAQKANLQDGFMQIKPGNDNRKT